jgi:hypothetical protein
MPIGFYSNKSKNNDFQQGKNNKLKTWLDRRQSDTLKEVISLSSID